MKPRIYIDHWGLPTEPLYYYDTDEDEHREPVHCSCCGERIDEEADEWTYLRCQQAHQKCVDEYRKWGSEMEESKKNIIMETKKQTTKGQDVKKSRKQNATPQPEQVFDYLGSLLGSYNAYIGAV